MNITETLETLETWGIEVLDDNTGRRIDDKGIEFDGITFRSVEDSTFTLSLRARDAEDVENCLTAFVEECGAIIRDINAEEQGAARLLMAYGEVMGDTTWRDLNGREAAENYLGDVYLYRDAEEVWKDHYADVLMVDLPEHLERYSGVILDAMAHDASVAGEFTEAMGLVFRTV